MSFSNSNISDYEESMTESDNISYLDRIAPLIKDVKVDNELINSMMVKQSDEIVNIKLPSDNEGSRNDLSNIIQTIFTRFMSNPNKKIGCVKKSKS
ncbi:unnamed protein product [Macrosiphum euphorbiae]|uniref:Uncharacterized protein n=1 Tax=Macrosiphum euphorbiae TaxID=13131 RepID=A0AAV0Y2Z2_9HEMI|nr:unnamed protein product [Macrosiphum euphorbiae]